MKHWIGNAKASNDDAERIRTDSMMSSHSMGNKQKSGESEEELKMSLLIESEEQAALD